MKGSIFTLLLVLMTFSMSNAYVVVQTGQFDKTNSIELMSKSGFDISVVGKMSAGEIAKLTPAKYKEMRGEKLTLKQVVALKSIQSKMKKEGFSAGSDLSKGVYILLAFVGWGFLGIGLLTDWKGNEWWMCLLLTALCWLPGFIYALVKMKNYY